MTSVTAAFTTEFYVLRDLDSLKRWPRLPLVMPVSVAVALQECGGWRVAFGGRKRPRPRCSSEKVGQWECQVAPAGGP